MFTCLFRSVLHQCVQLLPVALFLKNKLKRVNIPSFIILTNHLGFLFETFSSDLLHKFSAISLKCHKSYKASKHQLYRLCCS